MSNNLSVISKSKLSTSLMTDSTGTQIGTTVKYLPFGGTRSGSVPTDKLFTGQRLDATGLYYYNARYYDATIGRFISPDTVIQSMANPQCFNRYSYCFNNPLRYTDPSGHIVTFFGYNLDKVMSSGDYMTMCMVGTSNVFKAYETINLIDNTITSVLEKDPNITFDFSEKDLGGSQNGYINGAVSDYDPQKSNIAYTIFNTNSEVPDRSLEGITRNMAHELVHDYGHTLDLKDTVKDTKFEECVADIYSSAICNRLGISHDNIYSPWAIPVDSKYYTYDNYKRLEVYPAAYFYSVQLSLIFPMADIKIP
jgi:RHS repeat-associated protein